ncbi:MAG: hypothetical protein HQ559_00140, partial [Lentisphaerae bacterium]|nr:hypothetical protein [Lentisphaerota bacterium]
MLGAPNTTMGGNRSESLVIQGNLIYGRPGEAVAISFRVALQGGLRGKTAWLLAESSDGASAVPRTGRLLRNERRKLTEGWQVSRLLPVSDILAAPVVGPGQASGWEPV